MSGKKLPEKDELKVSANTMAVLRRRYLLKDDKHNIIETPDELFRRVGSHVSKAESSYKSKESPHEVEEKFYRMMRRLEFLPNSPTLMNAGTASGQLSACFVLPVQDSMDGIFEALKNMAKIHQSGGGTGFSFSNLRRKGALVSSTKGDASGPVSFMSIFDIATGIIVQGGRRRGANMGILRCDHPDIIEFVDSKTQKGKFENFNLSVSVTDEFMEAVKHNGSYYLKEPQTGEKIESVRARDVFEHIVNAAWLCGDPGLVFIDEINRCNPVPGAGRIEATNPCGELPLIAYESCNLGSINLSKMVKEGAPDWEKLKGTIRWANRFLDDVIEVNDYPLAEIKRVTQANRKIGLGVMGFADMLVQLSIGYNSPEARQFAEELMRFIHTESVNASLQLAAERGVFGNFSESVYAGQNKRLRNAAVNAIAPTGTISIIAGCSSGIEPLFAISFVRDVLAGSRLFETNAFFERQARRHGLNDEEVFARIARAGSLQKIDAFPDALKQVFVTAFDITGEEHLQMQSAFQRYTDNAVSKTVNLPAEASIDALGKIYQMAYELKCKGITVYRYGSREGQVLSFAGRDRAIRAGPQYRGGCFTGPCAF